MRQTRWNTSHKKTYPPAIPSQIPLKSRGRRGGPRETSEGPVSDGHVRREREPGPGGGPKPSTPSCTSTGWASNPGNSYVKSSDNHHLLISSAGFQKDSRFRARTQSSPVQEALWPDAQSPGNSQEPIPSCVVPGHRTSRGLLAGPGVRPASQRATAQLALQHPALATKRNKAVRPGGRTLPLPGGPSTHTPGAFFLGDDHRPKSHADLGYKMGKRLKKGDGQGAQEKPPVLVVPIWRCCPRSRQRKGHLEADHHKVSTNSMEDAWGDASGYLIIKNAAQCGRHSRWLPAWAPGSGSPGFKSR